MAIKQASKSWLSILGLSVTISLAGCNTMVDVPAPDTTPIQTLQALDSSNPVLNRNNVTKCPPFNPEKTMCTMQYDPVCVKVKTKLGTSQLTAGNACSACGSPEAIEYTNGECS